MTVMFSQKQKPFFLLLTYTSKSLQVDEARLERLIYKHRHVFHKHSCNARDPTLKRSLVQDLSL